MIKAAAASSKVRYILATAVVISLAGLASAVWAFVTSQNHYTAQVDFATKSEDFLSALKDVETGYRGFVITGSEEFLAPNQQALQHLKDVQEGMSTAATAIGVDAAKLAPLFQAATAKLNFADEVIAARRTNFDAAQKLILTREGKLQMDAVRSAVQSLKSTSNLEIELYAKRMRSIFVPIAVASLAILALASGLLLFLANKARTINSRSRMLLGDVIERAPVGLALIDRFQNIDQMNLTFGRMLGGKAKKNLGQPLSSVSPTVAEKLNARVADALQGRKGWKNSADDFVIELPEGMSSRYIKADVFPIKLLNDAGIEAEGAGIVLNDVTRQREWELELEEAKATAETANRAKSAFLANMSHELRTPLTAVLGYTELIEDDLRDRGSTEVLADLNKIAINARHLLQLINDVLDLSKIEAQKMDVHAVDFTLASLLTEVEAATGSLVSKNENVLEIECADPAAELHTDDLKIKQILLNVISNAAKFTTKGKITIRAEELLAGEVASIRFTVRDNGIGMSSEQLANLFQRFTQADQTTTRKYGGTGLGLALTKALSRMLGGDIEVISEEGKGTTFTITIPKTYQRREVADEQSAPTAPSAPNKAGDAQGRATVLVVDDEPAARELLERHLSREGFWVRSVSNGADALAAIAEHRPIAVLLDVMMPGIDGWHVLKEIRKNPETADIPVIMTTVLDEQNFAYAMGATAYLKKPVRRPDLAEALQSAAGASHDVLIVDDDEEASERLKEMLTRDGWNVRFARNGQEGLAALESRKPDLVLVDLVMPEMDGYAFIREVRKQPVYADMPLLVMTAGDINTAKVQKLRDATAGIVQKGAMPMADLVADLRRYAQGNEKR